MISCILSDIIRLTLATCSYQDCNKVCWDYLIAVGDYCPKVFNNDEYLLLWETLFNQCVPNYLFGGGH